MATQSTGRRAFLQSALPASAFALSAAVLPRSVIAVDGKAARRFLPVKISRDRVIRTTVGLRPYRSQGFVVKPDRLGEKVVIHNYGHGGAGITLSWGVASLAVDHICSIDHHSVAVIGCGVIGLATARLLQRRGKTVTIYAKELPPETTSNVAGGFWYPTSVYNPEKVSPQFVEQFRLACRISNRAFQLMVGNEYGVRWIDALDLESEQPRVEREQPGGAELYPGAELHKDAKHYFGFPYVRQFSTMLIEPSIYLNAMMRDFYIAGGKVIVKELHSRAEIAAFPEPVIFNCTGLGARALFSDEHLIPVRGQLEILLPQPEIDYCYLANAGYMFPRHDGIVLGGTFQHENWSLEVDPADTKEILDANAEVMKGLRR